MTLRARLLGGLLVLTALGLGVAGALTYREIRNFLVDRVDAQLEQAVRAPQLFFPGVNGEPPQGLRTLPPGTWAQLRDLRGAVVDTNSGVMPNLDAPQLPDE